MSNDARPVADTTNVTAIRKQWNLNRLSEKRKTRFVGGKLETYNASTGIQIGEIVHAGGVSQGVFIGTWEPKDAGGRGLGKIFNVYAAPQDLVDDADQKKIFKYNEALARLAQMKNWHGHDGSSYTTDKDFYAALKEGSYKGGWIIPPWELLTGLDMSGSMRQPDNLHAHKNKGSLRGTFCLEAKPSGFGYPAWYWSSTVDPHYPQHIMDMRLRDGEEGWQRRDVYRLSCRPIRLVPV